MQLADQHLRQSSRGRKVAAVLLAAYAVRKLSPYLWKRLQVSAQGSQGAQGAGLIKAVPSVQGNAPRNAVGGASERPSLVCGSSSCVDADGGQKKRSRRLVTSDLT